MADEFKLNESGINPVDSDSQKKDVYFSNEDFAKKINHQKEVERIKQRTAAKAKKRAANYTVASTYKFFIIVIAVSMVLSVYAVLCLNDIFGMTKTTSSVTVSYNQKIEKPSQAIELLADNGLIKCKNFCKLFVSVADMLLPSYDCAGPYEAGVYYLYGKMGLEGMLITMQGAPENTETVRLTFPEGYTTADIVNKLVDNEVCDRAALLKVIESTDYSYSLVANLESSEEAPYRLEGYLFPETYDFYIGQSASSTIETFLSTTEKKITEEYRNRAKELGFTMQEVMIIASIVQAEAGTNEQMPIIASIIENRLKDQTNFPTLGCQSTTDYINNKVAPSLSSTSAHTADYYLKYYNTNNDSQFKGLPKGPICNPGLAAIEAVLWPEDTDDYFFFHDNKRNLYTAANITEFRNKVKTYAPYLEY